MANPVVNLVSAWAEYDQQFPHQPIEHFCRYYLAQKQQPESKPDLTRSQQQGNLLRTLGRISSAYSFYHRAAMTQTSLPSADSFYYLNGLSYLGEVRKTELINYLFAEYTTGMEAINRLLASNFISERADPRDKRAKLIQLTPTGRQALEKAYLYAAKAAEMLFHPVGDDTLELAESLLKPVEQRHTQVMPELKTKEFESLYNQLMGNP
ncbi:MarR family winged helix-turn-helix transcriptional regulator [Spirosoma pollinicola]|uniref:HTH marR-type domain-containing protein n=1 Tax=Spirosoma pollinicola TaxID=2057025 RepID=A0A2K8Z2F6_9BACT|nr:MarR family winged helix-turn-helix transcriptional regulator [Spirosoma pollinicola]AUD04062.1 hypothetical protein CWM47_20850 [Spirosoma pollinicola]